MATNDGHQQIVGWLREQGHTSDEIEKVMAKLEEYDRQMVHESIFDSIERGSFDLSEIIKEALGEDS